MCATGWEHGNSLNEYRLVARYSQTGYVLSVDRILPVCLVVVVCLAITGCRDARKDVANAWLMAHPPVGLAIETPPERIAVLDTPPGATATATVHYRLIRPTLEIRDISVLPRAMDVSRRMAAVQGWAIGTLPTNDSVRQQIVATAAAAQARFPVKRIVLPAGSTVDALAELSLSKTASGWGVTDGKITPTLQGSLVDNPAAPLEDSPQTAAKLGALESAALDLEHLKADYLARQKRAAEKSLADLRARIRTGSVFEGALADQTPVRLVVERGLESGKPATVVLTVQRGELSSVRYTGSLAQLPNGQYVWQASLVAPLSAKPDGSLPGPDTNGALSLVSNSEGLSGTIRTGTTPPSQLELHHAGVADLIPDPALQPAPGN